ncbi:MAG: glutathione S-transferase family protein, partial [Proteobacteria bacterium]|nr:glutathione S-transferase family protein [Pseudomonadota bacterium]
EMGLPYRLRDVDLLAGVENDPEFLAVNPAGFIPALTDGDVVMVESIAILEYLLARHGPSPLAPPPADPAFPAYQQFLHLGEAGLAASVYFVSGARNIAPAAERDNWSARQALDVFQTRLGLVTRQLARAPYMAGDRFTAADISVTYALELAGRNIDYPFGEAEQAYLARTTARDGYRRAMAACHATRGWSERVAARRAAAQGSPP